MKQVRFFSMMLTMLAMCINFSACGDDDNDNGTVVTDCASSVVGVYTGKLSSGGTVTQDAYVVTIKKVTATVVSVSALFYGTNSDGSAKSFNYNVSQSGAQYNLTSSNDTNTSIVISGRSLSLSFLNAGGTMTSFNGIKD